MARSKGPCRLVWLCPTEDKTAICYRHYHNCYGSALHDGLCYGASGEGHDPTGPGDMLPSVTAAYAEMRQRGWRP